MDFPGIKKDGKFVCPPAIAEQHRKYWDRIKDGTLVIKSLVVPRKDKTQNQLGAIWGLMLTQAELILDERGYDSSFLYNLDTPTGVRISKDTLCTFFYNICPIYNEKGEYITLSKADTKEAAKFFDDVRNFMASQWSIILEDPNKEWKRT